MLQSRGKLDDTLAAMFSNVEYKDDYLFYAHIIGQCSIKVREDLPAPAGVAFVIDHYNLYINPAQFDTFTLLERLAILKHESLHIILDHLKHRNEGKQPLIWNYAADCALNQSIEKDHLPTTAVLPESLGKSLKIKIPTNKHAEYYYDLIKDKLKEDSEKNGESADGGENEGEPSEGNGMPQLMDSHETWNESTGDKDLKEDITKKMIEKSMTNTIKGKGKVPAECSDWIELHTRKAEVNWKKVLRGIIGNKRVGSRSTIMRSDRRFPKREDLRGKVKDRMFNLLVIADVSGSMSTKAITSTLAEVRHICDITKTEVDLIQVDTKAFEPEKLNKNTKTISRKGQGGTFLSSAIEMAKEHKIDYQAVVVLTDGGLFGDDVHNFHALNKKVIWLIEEDGFILDEMSTGRMQVFRLKSSE